LGCTKLTVAVNRAVGKTLTVQRRWLVNLRAETGLVQAVSLAGPFIMSSQGKP